MSLDDFARIAAGGFSIVAAVSAAAYTAIKVLRSDRTYAHLIGTLEEDRSYLRAQLDKERSTSEQVEARLNTRIRTLSEQAAAERGELYRQIEDLRRALHQQGLRTDRREGD